MHATDEQREAWHEKAQSGLTLTQQIHAELIDKGLMKKTATPILSHEDLIAASVRPDISMFLERQRNAPRKVGPPPAFVYDDAAPEVVEAPDWFASNGEFDVSVIVPLYNSRECVEAQIASWDVDYGDLRVEVIYVDDCCPQSSHEAILPAWESRKSELNAPVGKIVRRLMNGGFSAACNTGARHASGRYLVFLNADCTVTPNWLHALYGCISESEQLGIVGNLQLKPRPEGVVINSCGSQWHWSTGCFEHIGGRPPVETPAVDMERGPREMVTGACFIIDSQLFWSVGGFDTGFAVGYWEDSDLCMKVRRAGREVFFESRSVVYHRVAHSGASEHPHQAANRQRFHRRWVDTGIIDRYVSQKRSFNPGTILVKRLGANGDVLVAAAVAGAIRSRYPNSRIVFQTLCKQMLVNNPFVDEVIDGGVSVNADAVFDFDLSRELLPYANILAAFADVAGERPEDCRFFMQTDNVHGLPERYVAMHPGPPGSHDWKGRAWPLDRSSEVAARIAESGMPVVIVGDIKQPDDELFVRDGITDMRGKINLHQMAFVVRNAHAFVGIDSMPFHVSQTFNIPSVVVFGSVRPEVVIYRQNVTPVVAHELPCLGCHSDERVPCHVTRVCRMGDERCLGMVSVDDLYSAVANKLESLEN